MLPSIAQYIFVTEDTITYFNLIIYVTIAPCSHLYHLFSSTQIHAEYLQLLHISLLVYYKED